MIDTILGALDISLYKKDKYLLWRTYMRGKGTKDNRHKLFIVLENHDLTYKWNLINKTNKQAK